MGILWTETGQEQLFLAVNGDERRFGLNFNPHAGDLFVFYNGLIVSKEDYELDGRTLVLKFDPGADSHILCRLVV